MPCRYPSVFQGAAVNAVVLPYRSSLASDADVPGTTAAQLSALVQQETLLALLKYGSVGVTELTGNADECDVRKVLKQLTGEDDQGSVLAGTRTGLERPTSANPNGPRVGSGLALIWGRIYSEHERIYVQSYIRFLRVGAPEAVDVELSGPGSGRLHLAGSLPQRGVAMPPRVLTKSDVAAIERAGRTAFVLRNSPREESSGTPLTTSPLEPLVYGVQEVQGDWLHVRSPITQREGWMRARYDDKTWALRRFLPELGYLDGVAGYLRLRVADRFPLAGPERVRAAMDKAFADFELALGQEAAPEATSLARAMRGVELWNQKDGDTSTRRSAARLCREAFERLPESAGTRVLAAVTAAGVDGPIHEASVAQLDRGLLGALALEPANLDALRNLESLYEFASKNDVTLYAPAELDVRLAAIKATLASPAQ